MGSWTWWFQIVVLALALGVFIVAYQSWLNIQVNVSNVVGLTGDFGPQGFLGLRGAKGNIGPIGPIGRTGPTGGTGPTGSIGATSATGGTGPTGPTGPQGYLGAVTFTGPTGLTGFTGFPSNTGAMGPTGSATVPGPTGPTGGTGSSRSPYVFATYVMPTYTLTAPFTIISVPLQDGRQMQEQSRVEFNGGAFTYNQGAIAFPQTPTDAVFNIRVSIAGAIVGGTVNDYAHLEFPNLPITAANWIVGTTFSPDASRHLFAATFNDTFPPYVFGYSGDLSYGIILSSGFNPTSTLIVTLLTVELAQLSM
jgi:hypothetical protein